ncbi:flavin reductase [Geothrix rubra]|uniref:Flavin reductase n=1 Tax=Geothrix rubra TaxID=2927977 RepID=A0ABQ5Q693_9BACT|nr:flavin reductase family protein [Geothrix rubra]GLH69836.1 flavin reductase [Geothrix rubra]
MHKVVHPKMLYFGTPVVLISTLNPDGSPNLAPMSSAWWLGDACLLGMSRRSRTVENLVREGECVLNLPSQALVGAVDRLALLTGSDPVPPYKAALGYRHEARKFEAAGLTPEPADLVKPPRALECPVHLEAKVRGIRRVGGEDSHLAAIETQVVRVHLDEALLMAREGDYIDPERWRPLIMSFCDFFGLEGGPLLPSRLARAWRPPAAS